MSDFIVGDLKVEAEAAQSLLANLRDVLADDEQATADAIEGETSLMDVIAEATARIGELAAMRGGIQDYVEKIYARLERLKRQEDLIRTALLSAVAATGLKKLELPAATLTLKATPQSVVITSEADIPSTFWKAADPKLDRKAVLAALKDKQAVPGAELSNGGVTIQIRWS